MRMAQDVETTIDTPTRLANGILALGLLVPATARQGILDYAELVSEWNRTSLRHAGYDDSVIASYILGCLGALPHLQPGTLCDVGSGTGLPGIPFALARPADAVTLIESNHRKATFLKEAARSLGLSNVEVVAKRVESWSGRSFDTVVSRALCDLDEFVRLAGRLCGPAGTVAALKAVYPFEELQQIPAGFRVREVIRVDVPTVHQQYLVLIDPVH